VGIQFGAGGATRAAELASEGAGDVGWAVEKVCEGVVLGAEGL
jgi:hypothetical protein